MKYLGKFIYLLVFISSAIYIINHNKTYELAQIIDGYAIDFSVKKGGKLYFYANALNENKRAKVYIYNIKNEKVDSVILHVKPQYKNLLKVAYKNGYQYSNLLSYDTKGLTSGLYFINNIIPFLIKNINLEKGITVVVPFSNLMALNAIGGKSFDPENSTGNSAATHLSLLRPLSFSRSESEFLNYIDSVYGKLKVNYISDLDLLNYDNLAKSKLLIIYGYSAFWTLEQRKNFDRFQKDGGNVLAISNYIMNNKYLYYPKLKQISFTRANDSIANVEERTGIWDNPIYNYATVNSIGCNYTINNDLSKLSATNKGLILLNKKLLLFDKIDTSSNLLKYSNFNTLKIHVIEGKPLADRNSGIFYSKEIIAYFNPDKQHQNLGGIFLLQKYKNSGKLIVISSSDWVNNETFSNMNITIATKNIIDFLLL
jgi:hypothetical protein